MGASLLERVYRAVEAFDVEAVRACLTEDAFVFGPEAGGVQTSAAAVADDLGRRLEQLRRRGERLRLRTERSLQGPRWVFDEVVAEVVQEETVVASVPLRVTALLAPDGDGWRIAAGYWSEPFPTQEEQDAVKHSGLLQPGDLLHGPVADEARPLADLLAAALARPALLPDLYSGRDDAVTIGSVVDEVFLGPAAPAVWREFVGFASAFTPRGPMRASTVGPDLGWLAANIDIGMPPTPYRFFYVWLREGTEWRIVVSHDAVSRDPCRRR